MNLFLCVYNYQYERSYMDTGGHQYWRKSKEKREKKELENRRDSYSSSDVEGYVGEKALTHKPVWGEVTNQIHTGWGRITGEKPGKRGEEVLNPHMGIPLEAQPIEPPRHRKRQIDEYIAKYGAQGAQLDKQYIEEFKDELGQVRADGTHMSPIIAPALVKKLKKIHEEREKARGGGQDAKELETMLEDHGHMGKKFNPQGEGQQYKIGDVVPVEMDEGAQEALTDHLPKWKQKKLKDQKEPEWLKNKVLKDMGRQYLKHFKPKSHIERVKAEMERDSENPDVPSDANQERWKQRENQLMEEWLEMDPSKQLDQARNKKKRPLVMEKAKRPRTS